MSEEGKVKRMEYALEHIKNILSDKDTLDWNISICRDNDIPEVRDGSGKRVSLPYISYERIEFNISRVRNT